MLIVDVDVDVDVDVGVADVVGVVDVDDGVFEGVVDGVIKGVVEGEVEGVVVPASQRGAGTDTLSQSDNANAIAPHSICCICEQ